MILADTSGLLALLDEGERQHQRVREAVAADRGPLVTIDLVLAELDFLLLTRLGQPAATAFLEQLLEGRCVREPVAQADLERAREILRAFEDPRFGLTDAALMAVAERLAAPVLTLDRRHFGTFRDRRGEPLRIVP